MFQSSTIHIAIYGLVSCKSMLHDDAAVFAVTVCGKFTMYGVTVHGGT